MKRSGNPVPAGTADDILEAGRRFYDSLSPETSGFFRMMLEGERMDILAREGKEFEIKSREITIAKNEITAIDNTAGTIDFDVTCSKGTYIRTICDDIGRTLGCGAAMTSLVRTKSGYFDIHDALDLADLLEMSDEEIGECIIPMDETLLNLGIIELNDNRFTAFINGNTSGTGYKVLTESKFSISSCKKTQNRKIYRVYNRECFLGTAFLDGRELVPAKVILR